MNIQLPLLRSMYLVITNDLYRLSKDFDLRLEHKGIL
jgi:hypothetical protein